MLKAQEFFSSFPVLETPRLRLRPLRLEDAQQYYEMFNHPKSRQYLASEDIPYSVDAAIREIEYWKGLFSRWESVFWGVADLHDDILIGSIGFNTMHFANHRAEISYDLHHAHWRKGFMTEAMTVVLDLMFRDLGFNRVEARTMQGNIPSQTLLKKFGFSYEGLQRGYRVTGGKSIDVMLYAILKEEWVETA
jgi:ribosomal-protein-alanine N-acetyltransferase